MKTVAVEIPIELLNDLIQDCALEIEFLEDDRLSFNDVTEKIELLGKFQENLTNVLDNLQVEL